MDAKRDADIDPAPLAGKRVAILGYGNQGRAQALNLHDSGIDVVVGLRDGSSSRARVERDGLTAVSLADAAASADLVMLLAPDESLSALYRTVEPQLRHGAALGFSHGLAIRFQLIVPRADLDVIMVAPKGPGTALRTLYKQGKGMIALTAVAQDASGGAEALALAYGRAIGCGRTGLPSSCHVVAVADGIGQAGNEATKFGSGVPGVYVSLPPCSNRIRTGGSASKSASAWS